ncbi:hypothetical protein [Bifidobacterium avesanii]|uniref:Secreted protein n=1 Tax=Bifidobacterium avesanii TaxID=1798157 RepID=A0A7K3TGS5_9BIFI|nr:hypothetical protein [Bifidobacterium avesanii]KAB8293572.1 hypothetical protein DSM100685_0640 [Bifidobacterium avesanii]NEG78291.1 hypothetical protein [Bifidobacterium avesanii]
MFKRIFWIGVGVAAGVVLAAKAQAYVKAHTPDGARQFVLGPDQDNVTVRTLAALWEDFNQAREAREAELSARYLAKR